MECVKGCDELFVRFEVCKGIRKHISYLLVWNFISFVVPWKKLSPWKMSSWKKLSPWEKNLSTSGVESFPKEWRKKLKFDFAWGGCCKSCTNVKFRMFFFFSSFFSYNVIRDFPPLSWSFSWYLCIFCIAHIIMTLHWGVVNNEMLLVALLASIEIRLELNQEIPVWCVAL